MLEEKPNPEYIPDIDIRLLKNFKPNIEWILEPGDMLYIPPNIAHHGVSLEDSLSYSLGFKSIRYKDLLDHHITQVLSEIDDASFHDQNTKAAVDPLLIDDEIVENIYQDLMKAISDKETFKKSLLMYLSRPKNIIENSSADEESIILKDLKKLKPFKRDIWAKLIANQQTATEYQISINTKLIDVKKETYLKLKSFFLTDADDELVLTKNDVANIELLEVLSGLIFEGIFYFV
jgi:50S ribosomal protein L16 3-hydroxylase